MYNWIESTFNVSGGATQVIAAILALIVVLLLFSIFVFVLKRLTGSSAPQNRSRQPRIAVMDSTNVDARRQLVLIRRDNVEHLLLVGGPSDLVVEQNIVRNAPVSAQRQAPNAAPASTGPGTMKMPSAPGPDIPARPEEAERQPVAAIARQEPVPTVPLKTRAEPTVRPAPKAAGAGAMIRPVSPLKNEDKTPPVAAPVSPVVSRPTLEKETGTRPDRAADLLKAATQNGFNRSTNALQNVREDTAEETGAGTVPKNRTEPEIGDAFKLKEEPEPKPAPEPGLERDASQSNEGASAPLKSLGRSIAAREQRASQAVHSITPPSSGPAARAKTALLTPVQVPKEPEDSGFVFKEQPLADAGTEPVDPAGSAVEVNRQDEKLKMSDVFGNTERFNWAEDEPAEAAEADGVGEDAPADVESAASEDAPAVSPRELKLDLEMDDLIDSETPEPQKTGPLEDVSVAPAPTAKDPEMRSEGSAPQAMKQSATLDIVPGAEPEPRVVQGLGDKNPIEDEMAKILFELGGQQNR
nr:flagellar biosynthetic protein FliO [uncultured Roseibium sp.]